MGIIMTIMNKDAEVLQATEASIGVDDSLEKKDDDSLTENLSDKENVGKESEEEGNEDYFTEEEYLESARECFDVVYNLYTTEDGWTTCTGDDTSLSVVESRSSPKTGKIYKLTGTLDIDTTSLFEEMYYNLADSPQWNPTVLEFQTIQVINDSTEVIYSIAAEGGGGVIAARDFVNLRQWVVKDGIHFITGVACEHPDMPTNKDYVRATNRPGAMIIEDVEGNPNKSKLTWILNTDLKGWIPKGLIDSALPSVMQEFFKHLKQRCDEIMSGGDQLESTRLEEV